METVSTQKENMCPATNLSALMARLRKTIWDLFEVDNNEKDIHYINRYFKNYLLRLKKMIPHKKFKLNKLNI